MCLGFHNINQPAMNGIAVGTPFTAKSQVFRCTGEGCYADKCKIRLATYLLQMDVFNALAAKYIQVPLIFPIQRIQIKDFTDLLPGSDGHFTTANTLALKHCDAIFTVFRNGENARTCFENPFITHTHSSSYLVELSAPPNPYSHNNVKSLMKSHSKRMTRINDRDYH